ncbi:MAG: hypothetical protein AAF986_09730, partial [Pseudomonadota bacterium]
MGIKRFLTAAAACTVVAMGGIVSAQAQEAFSYSRNGGGGGTGGNDLQFFELHYATNGFDAGLSGKINFKSEVVKSGNDGRIGGFWLVVSDGPNPKNQIGEYAILYGDLINNRITAYEYNGDNNATSFIDPGNFLQTFENPFTINQSNGHVDFEIDVTSINMAPLGPEWDGVNFGVGTHKIGVWFHFSRDLRVNYAMKNGNLELTKFNLRHQGYVDFADKDAGKKD